MLSSLQHIQPRLQNQLATVRVTRQTNPRSFPLTFTPNYSALSSHGVQEQGSFTHRYQRRRAASTEANPAVSPRRCPRPDSSDGSSLNPAPKHSKWGKAIAPKRFFVQPPKLQLNKIERLGKKQNNAPYLNLRY